MWTVHTVLKSQRNMLTIQGIELEVISDLFW